MSVDIRDFGYSLLKLLEIPPAARTPENIEEIYELTKNFNFFQELTEKEDNPRLHQECCKVLMAKEFLKNSYVCKKGDVGDAFYLVLQGKVAVISDDLNYPLNLEEKDIEEYIQESQALNLLKFDEEGVGKIIATIKQGHSFGEMALINDKPRYFSIKCLEPTILGVLHKNDYQIISKAHEKQLNEKIKFLKAIDAFKNWSKIALQKIIFFFKTSEYKKGSIVYKEGDKPNNVYIIKEGEFIFTQNFPLELGLKVSGEEFGSLTKRKFEKIVRVKRLNIVVKQKGEIFGYDEIYENKLGREFTCICDSLRGELMVISEKNFTRKIANTETLKQIEENCCKAKKWLDLRVDALKTTERLKDDLSFTPYNKIKHVRKNSEGSEVKLPVIFNPPVTAKGTRPNPVQRFISLNRKKTKLEQELGISELNMAPADVNSLKAQQRPARGGSLLITQSSNVPVFHNYYSTRDV